MNIAENIITMQRKNLKEANNYRFTHKGNEYRLLYREGIGEYFDIDVRDRVSGDFKFANGFYAYALQSAEEVIKYAKNLICGI